MPASANARYLLPALLVMAGFFPLASPGEPSPLPRYEKAVAPKITHYGKYSKLEFSRGENLVKGVEEGEQGIQVEVPAPASGFALDSLLSLSGIAAKVADKTVVYVGEKHDRYGDHLMQLEMIRSLHRQHRKLAIGMEMFEGRYQKALDDYIAGTIDEKTFLQKSHYFTTWRFNYHLYRDILKFAREQRLPVVALNINHEIVREVARKGLAGLDTGERSLLPQEMDFSDEAYRERLQKIFQMHQREFPEDLAFTSFEHFYQAQILWDEAMAEKTASFLASHPDHRLVVLAGRGHLEYRSGIPARVHRRNPTPHAIILPRPEAPPQPNFADFLVFTPDVEAPVSPKLMVMLETRDSRLQVQDFPPGSGAAEAGMKKGDIIVGVEDQPVGDINDLRAFLFCKRPGDKVKVTVRRGDRKLELEVELRSPRHSSR